MYEGGKSAVSDAALSVWALLSNPAGVSEQVANGLMGLSKDPLGSFVSIAEASQTQEAMATLYDMQGNSAASAAIRAQSATEFALNFLPTNRAKAVAELSLGRKLGSEGPCCFAAGTMVSTPDGDRAIDTLKVGDIVWSKPERGGKPFAAAILATHVRTDQPIYRLKLKSVRQDGEVENETLLVTPGHPFYVAAQRDFVPVIDLKPGDRLQSLDDGASENTSSEVESLELYLPEGKTYNLTVDVGHTFYVGKFKTWVHNTGPCVLPEGDFGANGVKGTGTSLSPVFKDTDTGLNAINPITSSNQGRIQELGMDPDKGKLALHEGQAAVQLENTFGGTLKRVEPMLGQKNPDFVFLDGPYSGKTVDFMWTDSSRFEQMNKFFSNNASQNQRQLIDHLNKADIVPIDYRNLTSGNQEMVNEWLKSLTQEQKSKILILR